MDHHRQTILQLVAQRRLSPADAERLLATWNLAHEDAWLILTCLLLALLPQHAPLHPMLHPLFVTVHAACAHLPVSLASLGQLFSKLHRITGGLQ